MIDVHLVGSASSLYENLSLSWRHRARSLERTSADEFPAAIERIAARRPEWIVYCGHAAMSSWDEPLNIADDPSQVEQLARIAIEIGSRLAVISSDRVLAGPAMFHDESEPAALDEQAQRLRALEQAALAVDGGAHRVLVVRTNAFGWSAGGESFAERVWRALECSQLVDVPAYSFATPILASDLAEVLLRCFRARLHGIVHLGGAERTSPFRFAHELATVAGFDRRLVRANVDAIAHDGPDCGPVEQVNRVACETSLSSRLVRRELDVALPLLRESLCRFVEQATSGYRDQLRGAADDHFARAA